MQRQQQNDSNNSCNDLKEESQNDHKEAFSTGCLALMKEGDFYLSVGYFHY